MAIDLAQGRVERALEQGAMSKRMWPHVLVLSEVDEEMIKFYCRGFESTL